MNFEKATNYINAVKKEELLEKERLDIEVSEAHIKWMNELREKYNDIISKIEKYYNGIVDNINPGKKPENISIKDYDDSLTFFNYTYVEDIPEERDPYGGLKDRVILDSDKNLKELNELLREIYNDMDSERTKATVLSEVLKLHGMRIRANLRIEKKYPCTHPFHYGKSIPDTFVISSYDLDFMKISTYTPLVITMNFPYIHDFHKFDTSEFYAPFDPKEAKNGAMLYYTYRLADSSFMIDRSTVKHLFTKFF